MKKKIVLIFIIIFLPSFQSVGQISELSLMGIDAGDFMEAPKPDPDPDPEYKEYERPTSKIGEEEEKFKDSSYGYTGGGNFNIPPVNKLSQDPLEYFGYSYFLNDQDVLFSQANVPVPPNYLIGPEDIIKIILYGNKNRTYELKVSRDGNIFFPEIGPLSVAGQTFDDTKKLIQAAITSQLIGTQVSITLGSLRSINIFILGAANKPGMYSISALSNITNALFYSGGVDTSGSLRNIKIKRNGETIVQFDLYDLFLNGDNSNDIRLMQDDVIFIEPIGKTAGIRGEVNRPSIYELKDGETLNQLIRFAGRLRPKADKSNAELTRIDQSTGSFELIKLDLESSEKMALNNGDIINIFPVNDKIQNAILVTGHALQPGFYPLVENMKILDLFPSPSDLLEMTDMNYILIKRKNKSNQKYFFRQINLEEAYIDPSSSENIRLFDQDEVLLLPSLLSPNLITTKLIKEQASIDTEIESSTIEEEWTSLTYLRKSLQSFDETETETEMSLDESESYYEYSIYDYCNVPKNLVLKLEDKEEYQTLDLTRDITNECRRQLIKPMISVAKKDNSINKMSTVSIYGGVHSPGEYPYTKDMSMLSAIHAAGGVLDGIFVSEVEIIKRNKAGKRFISTDSFASLSDADKVSLSKMDIITVKKLINENRTVRIYGEVNFPGIYPISESQTLSELIERAGGTSEDSDLKAAVFLREALRESEIRRIEDAAEEVQKRAILLSQSEDIGETSSSTEQIELLTSLLDDTKDYESLGRLVIDLEKIITGASKDLKLDDGDSLFIPKKKQTISVIGEVFVPNSHVYDGDLDFSDYVNLSGGFTDFADESSLYVIRSDGRIVSPSQLSSGFFRRQNNLEPGDTLVVPVKLNSFSQLKAATEITQIIYQMAIAAAAVNSF